MGNGNERKFIVHCMNPELLTPHGEREPAASRRATTTCWSPNPSWGTGTRPRSIKTGPRLMTPNPSWGTGTAPSTSSPARCRASPNPSWGTGTPSWAAEPPAWPPSPNPSWGTGTVVLEHSRVRAAGLLTPHGERERPVRRPLGRARAAPNPSWGTGTRTSPPTSSASRPS